MNMQYATAVVAHEKAQRPSAPVPARPAVVPAGSDSHPETRPWPRGCVCL